MIIYQNRRFVIDRFSSEQELEQVVKDHSEDIFGPDSIYLPKSLIRTPEGTGTIPDGVVIDLSTRRWFIIEAELSSHSVWNHIAPQVAKQLIACSQPASVRATTEMVINRVKEDAKFRVKFEELEVREIDIRRFLEGVFRSRPIVGIPIDHVGPDLQQWAETVKAEVKLWAIRKLVDQDDPKNVMYEVPEEYQASLDTTEPNATASRVTVSDLIERGLLAAGQKLFMSYRPRGSEQREFEATVLSNGDIEALGKTFSAPSYAGSYCMRSTGSDRDSCNGWIGWRTAAGAKLADLRQGFLEQDETAS